MATSTGISNPLFTKQDLGEERPEGETAPPGITARLSLVLIDDPHTTEADAFGSYLVYRKLEQTPARRGAGEVVEHRRGSRLSMVIGRVKDGTPVLHQTTPSSGPS